MYAAWRRVTVTFLVAVAAHLAPGTGWAASLDMPLQRVPAGGEPNGPDYDFWMGRYEVTVEQYVTFLNNAESNPNDERGAYLVFDPNNGDVGLPSSERPDDVFDISDTDRTFSLAPHYDLNYDPNLPVGSRYTHDPNDAKYPIVGVSWIGAVKFCNWLTIDRGLDPNQRCYTEGSTLTDWHPVTISTVDWVGRDLSDAERLALVGYLGFRLPMDNLGLQNGYVDGQPNPYNEWYKAAAYDPNAPGTERTWDNNGNLTRPYTIPPYHWRYGFGSDELDLTKANFVIYDDANSVRLPVPVGSYAANSNFYGIHDMSGNVYEWGQDYCNSIADPIRHASRGKGFNGGEPAASLRHYRRVHNGTHFVGFRVLQCGAFALTLQTVHGEWGTVAVNPESSAYSPGTEVVLTASPNPGEQFSCWTGDVPIGQELNNPLTVMMNQDRDITATFGAPPAQHTLTVTTDGEGSVDPNGGTYIEGTAGDIQATAAEGWGFTRWQGDVAAGHETDNPLHLVMDQDRALTAVFTQPQYDLTVNVTGQGRAEPNAGTYADGTEVEVLPIPESGWAFDHWEGDVISTKATDNPLTLVMDRSRSLTAIFEALPPPLFTLAIDTSGKGTVTPSSGPYSKGTSVRLRAQPDPGWVFSQWSGSVPAGHETDNPLTVVMDCDRGITAEFVEAPTEETTGLPCAAGVVALVLAALGLGGFVVRRCRRRRNQGQ